MATEIIDDLNHHLMIAMPQVKDELFQHSVLYIYEHDDKGSMGFVVNKPLPITLGDILRQLNIEVINPKADTIQILEGGPVSKEQLYVIQYRDPDDKEKGLKLVQPQEMLHAFANGKGLDNILPFLGYSGWTDNQLNQEIKNNDWLVCEANRNLLFETPTENRWQACMDNMGINIGTLIQNAGRA